MSIEDITTNDMYAEFVENIKKGKHFSFIRYGDGEWALMLKRDPIYRKAVTRWGPSVIKVGEWMLNHLKQSPSYYVGIQPLALRHWGSDILNVIDGQGMQTCNSDTLHKNSIRDNMQPFFDSLQSRNVVIVGPSYLKMNMFEYTHIVTPEVGAWDYLEKIRIEIRKAISASKDPVILYSCSLAAKLLIRDFHKQLGDSITQIDTGSVFDPYAGVDSRSYHSDVIKRLNIETKKKVHIK